MRIPAKFGFKGRLGKVPSWMIMLIIFVLISGCGERKSEVPENHRQYSDFGGSQDVKLYPVDEASQNPSFAQFRTELTRAIHEKDMRFLLEHLDENIKYSFGVNEHIAGFLKMWGLDARPQESRFWDELNQVLALGGTFNDEGKTIFTAPYTFTRFPEEFDAFQHYAIIDKDVIVYEASSTNSPVLGVLTYSIVRLLEKTTDPKNGNAPTWLKIQTMSGNTGFIPASYGRSPIDYRASFQESEDRWRLIFFVAGD